MIAAAMPTLGAGAMSVAEANARNRQASRSNPLADMTASIASIATATRDGERGFDVNATGIARLRATADSAAVGSLVFVPASASAAELEDIVACHLAAKASSTFATAGHPIPSDRIAVVLL